MKTILVLVCVGLLLCTGCMSTYDLTRDVAEVQRDELKARLLGETWTMQSRDGTLTKGTITAVNPDSITYLQENSGKTISVPTRDLATISSSPDAAGPILGLLGGGLLGGVIGGAVGVSEPTSQNLMGILIEREANGVSGAIVGALIGAPFGLIIGSQISAGNTFLLNRVGSGGLDTTVVIDQEDFISETITSVTFRWEGRDQIVPKLATEIHLQGNKDCIILPRPYLRR